MYKIKIGDAVVGESNTLIEAFSLIFLSINAHKYRESGVLFGNNSLVEILQGDRYVFSSQVDVFMGLLGFFNVPPTPKAL